MNSPRIGLWIFDKPRLRAVGGRYIAVNFEAVGTAIGWNVELDIMEIYYGKV